MRRYSTCALVASIPKTRELPAGLGKEEGTAPRDWPKNKRGPKSPRQQYDEQTCMVTNGSPQQLHAQLRVGNAPAHDN